jgi:putative transposase
MPYTKIWIHLIWTTKNRGKLISPELKPKLLSHIKEYTSARDIHLDFINCTSDHVHAIISMNPDQMLCRIMQLIKGESSSWINRSRLIHQHFAWQEEYIAYSLSESRLNYLREYIKNQEEHHRKKSLSEEISLILKKLEM